MKRHELTNFIPINRRLFEHPLWREERIFSKFEAWIYLLKEARFEDTKVYDGCKPVEVKRGQIYVSVRFLARAFGWSTNRVLYFLNLLVADRMIHKELVRETGQMIVTICNYSLYNSNRDSSETAVKRERNISETKSNKENKEKRENTASTAKPLWHENYEVYCHELKNALNNLLLDNEFIAERQCFRPNVDVPLSLQKAYTDYWSTQRAWQKRRKARTKELDYCEIFRNALDIPSNWVARKSGDFRRKLGSNQNLISEDNSADFSVDM